jgi:hypothetical protein
MAIFNLFTPLIGAPEALRVIMNAIVFRNIQETNILLRCWFKPIISVLVLVGKR